MRQVDAEPESILDGTADDRRELPRIERKSLVAASRPDPQFEYFRNAMLGARHYGFIRNRLVFVDRWLDHELKGDLAKLVLRDNVQGIVAALNSTRAERRFGAAARRRATGSAP